LLPPRDWQRYLNRELDPAGIQEDPPDFTPVSEVWSDYDADEIYGDFTANDELEEITNVRSFQLGMARVLYDELGIPTTEYYHADAMGTTRVMTDAQGAAFGGAAYSAFGGLISGGTPHRYGFAGEWSYQAPSSDVPGDPYLSLPFLHLGHRYYDPGTGRFLQRDPTGLVGGVNVYAYAGNDPVSQVDPTGLGLWKWIKTAAKAAKKYAEELMGCSSKATVPLAAIDVTARALEGADDGVRIILGVGHRNKSIGDDKSAAEALDDLERGRSKYIKPGTGGEG